MARTKLDNDSLGLSSTQVAGRATFGVLGVSGQYAVTLNPDTAGNSVFNIKVGAAGADALVIATGSDAYGTPTERFRLDGLGNVTVPTGNLLLGLTSGTCHQFRKSVAEAGMVAAIAGTTAGGIYVFRADQSGYSTSNAALWVDKNSGNGRSINAGGTINASGADYAEYMTKAEGVGTIDKGAIVGIDVDGHLTDKWAAAVSFLIKSTDPSYVGGDVWGTAEVLGMARPVEPVLELPAYTGADNPGPRPDAPDPADLVDVADKALEQVDPATIDTELLAYDQALATYQADQLAHAEAIAAATKEFNEVTYPAYQAELATFEDLLEQARQKVDRMAYCGQVPVNVTGAAPGQYVVPIADGEGIAGQLVDAAAVTFEQYRRAVGIVQNILPDGRANVRVKPV